MKPINICNGAKLKDNITNTNYRILNVTEDMISLINMDKKYKCEITSVSTKLIKEKIQNETAEITEEQTNNIIVDTDLLSDSQKTKFERNKLIIETINSLYAPNYTGLNNKKKPAIINELIKKSKLTRKNFWHIIIKYLQSGCLESSLLHARPTTSCKDKTTTKKRGRTSLIEGCNGKNITDNDRKIMEKYKNKWLNNKLLTIQKCYDDMIIQHYTTETYKDGIYKCQELPADQRPTIYQFQYYVKEHSTKEARLSAKMGAQEFRNQKRVLTGTALNGVNGPGDIFEMDACELDISVVSLLDRNKTVGSPVVYFLVDVYSKLIVAASLSFDNNSILAMTNCLASLVENKEEILKKYGLTIIQTNNNLKLADVMPSNIKPRAIRVDHGADFTSKEKQRIANELSIEIKFVPPGTGSLKSVVERSFRAFQTNFTDLTAHAGTKDFTNGHSNHNKEAKLTIEDVCYLMYSFILEYNSTQHESMYDLTPDMVKNNVGRIPAEIWRYGIQHAGNPSYITDKSQYLFSLLKPVKAKIRRTGIIYNKLRYIPNNNDTATYEIMLEAKTGSIPFNIRIDLRTISKVYYTDKNGKLYAATLVDDINHRELANMTWTELESFRKKEKMLLAEKRIESDITRRAHRRNNTETVQLAKALTGKERAEDKNMRENRITEKANVAKAMSFDKRFGFAVTGQEPRIQQTTTDATPKTTDTKTTTPDEIDSKDISKMTEEEKQAYREELNNALILLAEDDI